MIGKLTLHHGESTAPPGLNFGAVMNMFFMPAARRGRKAPGAAARPAPDRAAAC